MLVAAATFRADEARKLHLSELCVLGLLAWALLGTALQFVAPLGEPVCVLVTAVGLAAFAWRPRAPELPALRRAEWPVLLALCLYLVHRTSLAPVGYDTGLYYLQALHWQHDGPLPLGLVNLHGRLAFNSVWFPIVGLGWWPRLELTAVFAANGALALTFVLFLLEELFGESRSARIGPARLFALALLLFFLLGGRTILEGHLGAPAPDLPAACFTLFTFALALRGEDGRSSTTALLVAASVLAVTTKVSQGPLLLVPLVVLWALRGKGPAGEGRRARRDLFVFVLSAALVVVWLGRGVWLSGCAVFPAGPTCLPLPWAVPEARVAEMTTWIRSWARTPGDPYSVAAGGAWDWLPLWWERFRAWPAFPYLAAGLSLGVLLSLSAPLVRRLRASPDSGPPSRRPALLLGVSLLGSAFWFLQAPDVRFGYGFLVAAPALALCLGLAHARLEGAVLRGAGLILLAALLFSAERTLIAPAGELPERAFAGWPDLPRPRTETRTTRHGVEVQVPHSTDDRCWGAARPCTPYFDDALDVIRTGPWTMWRLGTR